MKKNNVSKKGVFYYGFMDRVEIIEIVCQMCMQVKFVPENHVLGAECAMCPTSAIY